MIRECEAHREKLHTFYAESQTKQHLYNLVQLLIYMDLYYFHKMHIGYVHISCHSIALNNISKIFKQINVSYLILTFIYTI